ncbi:MarR family transcriptional regulator [Acetobacter sacchari]|uniref:MarR family transcriptional regulator n=1 Tax=Acetobacter sacchari TaxID=2661687 RepID=A0ABS3M170_9PROT|nr:MarR family transcriptional regulator [Acetobacter sacchari]MBO1361865.1 MarR family transcriptional regulator [Acetobacter sacchari]
MQNSDETLLSLGRMFGQTARRWRQILDTRLQPYGLTDATWQPLVELKRQGRPLNQKDIAAALLLDKSSVVRTLRNLESQGLITRVPDATDGRAWCVIITDRGLELCDTVLRVASSIEKEVFEMLGHQGPAVKVVVGEVLDIVMNIKN